MPGAPFPLTHLVFHLSIYFENTPAETIENFHKMDTHDGLPQEKAPVGQHDSGPGTISKVSAEIQHIDAIALSGTTMPDSFKHLDEKKILRKMDTRLIPVLALLYLLSFLDRKSHAASRPNQIALPVVLL